MSFPRYPKYKDSGAELLGQVPEHWDTRKVRWLFDIKKRIAGDVGFDGRLTHVQTSPNGGNRVAVDEP